MEQIIFSDTPEAMIFLHNLEEKLNKITYRVVIHFQPLANHHNVRCLNGSAHVRQSKDIKEVTCPLCLNPNTFKEHWALKVEELRTKHQYSPITGKKFERYNVQKLK